MKVVLLIGLNNYEYIGIIKAFKETTSAEEIEDQYCKAQELASMNFEKDYPLKVRIQKWIDAGFKYFPGIGGVTIVDREDVEITE